MKKGVTLIELVVALSITSILLVIGLKTFSKDVFTYKKLIKVDREESYAVEALRFIEGEIYDLHNNYIKVQGNTLMIKKSNGDKNLIRAVNKDHGKVRLVITYDKVVNANKVTNTITEDIKAFQIEEDKNLIFISIDTMEGRKYERCFGIREDKRVL